MNYFVKKKVINYPESQNNLTQGILLIYYLLSEAYGPYGRNIIVDSTQKKNLELYKEGSAILSKLKVRNLYDNLIILLLQDSFQKINKISGDGSKTFFSN